jgi:hypothetical protein
MSLKKKTVILLVAILLTFLEFNLIIRSAGFCEILRSVRGGDYTMLSRVYSKPPDVVVTAPSGPNAQEKGKTSQAQSG